jgi:hypothetical protein
LPFCVEAFLSLLSDHPVDIPLVARQKDEQFERIDSMLFIRTQYTLDDGSTYESDDCD